MLWGIVSVSGLSCTAPKGAQAPGKVCPMPAVPISGFTQSERRCRALWLWEEKKEKRTNKAIRARFNKFIGGEFGRGVIILCKDNAKILQELKMCF